MSLFFVVIALLAGFLAVAPHAGIDGKIAPIVKPHEFSIARWEFRTITGERVPSLLRHQNAGDLGTVVEYFKNAQQVRSLESTVDRATAGAQVDSAATQTQLNVLRKRQDALAGTVQETIERQINSTLREQGIHNPFVGFGFLFPPVNFEMARTPDVLVISPRDRIESISQTNLQPDLALSQAQDIESRVDKLGVSSLVTGIGGIGATFPTFVADDMDLRSTIDTAAHEWVHQYLAFKPLGFRYVLDLVGIAQNRDVTSMNETVADMIGTEIGKLVYDKYYKDEVAAISGQPSEEAGEEDDTAPAFDFNAEMRSIRKQVDSLLSQGKVDEAEQYMNERRDYLAGHGYYIRKLNQAYFAFYGSYADSATSVDPIGVEMRQLRSESGSIGQFLARASSITSLQQLEKATGP